MYMHQINCQSVVVVSRMEVAKDISQGQNTSSYIYNQFAGDDWLCCSNSSVFYNRQRAV